MKKIILWVLFMVPICAFSQFRENFSDGRFTSVQTQERATNWAGDVGKFIVNPDFQLQLNAPKETGFAQLCTASTLSTNVSWEFWMQLGFNPSSSNFAKVYLCSESEILTESSNSLFIRVGHTNKNLCLIMKTGSTEKVLITGVKDRLNAASPSLDIKAIVNGKGDFELYSKLKGESSYILEGSCHLETIPHSSYFGILCHYTSTRSSQFFFDNFVVRQLTEENPNNEDEDPKPVVSDNGNYGDLIFNEIMANPKVGEPEYVELYNRSAKTFHIKDWKFYYGDKPFVLPDTIVNPHEYIVLCKTTTINAFSSGVKTVGVTSFPALANTGKLLYLENKKGDLISWFEYSDKLYGSIDKKAGGWSLECIDPENLSNNASNWIASMATIGNTAGKINSVKSTNPDNQNPTVIAVEIKENKTLAVTFSKPMNKTTLIQKASYLLSNTNYTIEELQGDYPKGSTLLMRLNQLPPEGDVIRIKMEGVRDVSGFSLVENSFLIGSGKAANPLDVVLNEILFNAPAESEEYIELYNRSNKDIDLQYLSLATRKTDGSLNKAYPITTSPFLLYPGDYVAVTRNKEAVCKYYICRESALIMELATTPILNNTSGDIILLNNKTNEVIDEFVYNEKMHAEGIKDKKGIALERLNPNQKTNDAGSWHSASSDSGYGTPGYINSQFKQDVVTGMGDIVSINYPEFSLGSTIYEIQYRFNTPGNRCRAFLYDSMGRLISTIANNEMLGTEGKLSWQGNNSSGQKLHSGVYIVYVEVYTVDGKIKKFKLPAVMK